MSHGLGPQDAIERGAGTGWKRPAVMKFLQGSRQFDTSDSVELAAVIAKQHAETGLADADGVL